jgi:hypothetical protein
VGDGTAEMPYPVFLNCRIGIVIAFPEFSLRVVKLNVWRYDFAFLQIDILFHVELILIKKISATMNRQRQVGKIAKGRPLGMVRTVTFIFWYFGVARNYQSFFE